MPTSSPIGVTVRRATPGDAAQWLELLKAAVGPDYIARQIYEVESAAAQLAGSPGEETWLAEAEGKLLGSISLLVPGSPNDSLVANVGRRLALPESGAGGADEALLGKILDVCAARRQMAMLHVPASDEAQQRLLEKIGFVCVGFQPAKHLYRVREGVLFYVRIGAPAPATRLPLSQSLPQINELALAVLGSLRIPNPEMVRDGATGYPLQTELEIVDGSEAAFRAAKSSAGTVQPPVEISGQLNRGLGMFRIPNRSPDCALLGSREGKTVAGLTYYFDQYDRCLRLVDSYATDQLSGGALLRQAVKLAQERFRALYVEVDFLITAPRALKSAEQLGFVPVAYLPGFYRRGGICLDLVKMVKLDTAYSLDPMRLTRHAQALANLVDRNFHGQRMGLATVNLLRGLSAFEGLGDGELAKMASLFGQKLFQAKERIFSQGDSGDAAYIVVRGAVEIRLAESGKPLAVLRTGAIFGEQAFLEGAPRTATAVAIQPTILQVVHRPAFNTLIQTEPHLGLVVMRNIALELSRRLRKANLGPSANADNQTPPGS